MQALTSCTIGRSGFLNDFGVSFLLSRMDLESKDMSQEAETVSGPKTTKRGIMDQNR